MTAAWDSWQTGLPVLFAALLGIPSTHVAWETKPRTTVRGPRAQLNIIATPAQGVPDRRMVVDEGATFDIDATTITGTLTEQLTGQRQMVLQVSVWNSVQALPTSARALIERMRTRMDMESTRTALRDLDLAFVRTESPVNLDPTQDGRVISGWAVDVVLAYAAVETDSDNPTNWFTTARIRSDMVRDEGGDPLPTQVDVTVDLAPEA